MSDNNLTLLGTWYAGIELQDIYYSNNYTYLTNTDVGNFNIIDVSDPLAPNLVGYLESSEHASNVFVLDNYAYTVGIHYDMSTGYFRVIDISVPANPTEVSKYDLGQGAWDIYVKNNYAYIIQHFGQFIIFDISDPTNPREVGYCQAVDWGEGIFVENEYAYVVGAVGVPWAPTTARFCIINVSNPSNPNVIGSYEIHIGFNTSFRDVYISGNFAYVICTSSSAEGDMGSCSLRIIDISNLSQPVEAGIYEGWVTDVCVFNEYAYLAYGAGLLMLDINDPSNPQVKGYFHTGGERGAVSVCDSIIYVIKNKSLFILRNDITSGLRGEPTIPSHFTLAYNYPNPFNPSTIIRYSIPQVSKVVIRIFDILGNEIETFVNADKPAGTYEITWYAENLPSGVYFYRLQAGDYIETKKMVLMK